MAGCAGRNRSIFLSSTTLAIQKRCPQIEWPALEMQESNGDGCLRFGMTIRGLDGGRLAPYRVVQAGRSKRTE
jgi:hypothetical protein